MVRMTNLGYHLIISLSILSQGFLFSFSKSIRKSENDDVLLDTIALRKALRNGDTIDKSVAGEADHYTMDDSSNLNEEEERSIKSPGSRNSYFSPDMIPGVKQMAFTPLKNFARQADTGDETVELIHERRDIGEEENKFPIGRRDFDMLRCMLGRVYRPCWQI
ncbi:pro-MCH [Hyperolius riggenbachi]|uniref:pro-MCH n=1 Tax=Hyperolius riggenbachi TaxID=752182 RepID=UPI0035A275F9